MFGRPGRESSTENRAAGNGGSFGVVRAGMPRREDYQGAARAVAVYLAERQRPEGGFPGPDNYGVACALWLWSHFGVEFARQLDRAWQRLKDDPPRSHGEFNIYALLHCRPHLGERPVEALLRRIRPGARHSANWMLLRAACDIGQRGCLPSLFGRMEGRAALLRYARRGFICDRPGVRSFGYHAFCGALLADVWSRAQVRWAGRAAARAARFLAQFVLPNGDALYVGRGQEQIFGYGALLYLLEAAAGVTGEPEFADLADRVFKRVVSFQRRDGSLPLVLREGEEPEPWAPDATRPGWYTYNTYGDYLPFLGCMLLKAAEARSPPLGEALSVRPHPDFLVRRARRYTAVLARPGGAPTNDLSFPYVCVDGESIFPCYGVEGEEIRPEETPLPYGVLAGGTVYGFRDHLRYRISDDGLIGDSRLVRHARRFEFLEEGFDCSDEITFRRPVSFESFAPGNFLFRTVQAIVDPVFETWHRKARAILEIEPAGSICPEATVSASGVLVALRHLREGFEAKAGESCSVRLKVRFA